MKKLFFTFLLIPFFSFSQKYISKVSAINGQNVKYENTIYLTDSIITIKSPDYDLEYTVEKKINNLYQVYQFGNYFNITIIPQTGKSKGFKYTHAIVLADPNNILPPVIYYVTN